MRFGKENNNWRGGKSIASNGYVIIRVGKHHHLSDVRGYAYEHRMVAEQKLGRRLRDGEQVHHRNGNKQDNRIANIEVMASMAHHRQEHRKPGSNKKLIGQENPMIQCACGCGEWILKFDGSNRPREFVTGHNTGPREPQIKFLEVVGNRSRLQEVAEKTGQSLGACKCMASKLVREGKLKRLAKGIYGKD